MSKYGIEKNLERIMALVTAPYWEASRKATIYKLADESLKQIRYYKQLNQTIAELDDEIEGPGGE